MGLVGLHFKGTLTGKILTLFRNPLKGAGAGEGGGGEGREQSIPRSTDPRMSNNHKIQENLKT